MGFLSVENTIIQANKEETSQESNRRFRERNTNKFKRILFNNKNNSKILTNFNK